MADTNETTTTTPKFYVFTPDSLLAHDQEVAKKAKEYTDKNGGKIDIIKKNGETQTISATDKSVDISVPTKVSELDNDSKYITVADVPEGAAASTASPKMDGVAAVGTDPGFARGDHVHPTDTTRASQADMTDAQTRLTAAEGKLQGIKDGAQPNTIEGVDVNGVALTVDAKTKHVNVNVPTDNKNLTNGAGYQTDADVKTTVEGYGYQTSDQVDAKVAAHDVSATAHNDIRTEVAGIKTQLSNFLDADDTTLDQLSELIAAIKANQGSIADLTSNKVNTADVHTWTTEEVQTIADNAWA